MKIRGQGAMEYLMTYGWAILVVIIVGIVLWQSGVFGTGSGGVSGFDKIRVEDYAYSSGGFNASFENAAGQTIRTVNITYEGDLKTADIYLDQEWNAGAQDNWAPGKEYAVGLSNVNASACIDNSGSGYTLDVTIYYKSAANIAHTDSGRIRGTCE